MVTLIDKLRHIRDFLNANILERQLETDGILQAILSQSNCLFIGDPGTAKTKHIRLVSSLLGVRVFDTLLSATTKPDSIFGPIDVPALGRGVQRNKIAGYAADCEVLFFDEIFKANGIVLNPMLWLINEHQYRNGDEGIVQCPTMSVFAASNEIPTEVELRPIYDRFLLRFKVDYMKSEANIQRAMTQYLSAANVGAVEPISKENLIVLQDFTRRVQVPVEVQNAMINVRNQLKRTTGVDVSDRRLLHAQRVVQANAVLHGRAVALVSDIECLSNIFWDQIPTISKTRTIVLSNTHADMADLVAYEDEANSIWQIAIKTGEIEQAKKKLERIYEVVKNFKSPLGSKVRTVVKEKLDQATKTLEQRHDFVVIRTLVNAKPIYKLSVASALVWTPEQLRAVDFHWRKRDQYWWHDAPHGPKERRIRLRKKFEAKVKANLNVVPTIKRLT